MKYLLIVLILLAVVSPLMWFKSTPGQARAAAFRKRAGELGLRVQLVPDPDAPDDERQPSAVRYLVQTVRERHDGGPCSWTLLKSDHRGWASPWRGWRWFRRAAPEHLHPRIALAIEQLPADVTALREDRQGVAAYWRETGEPEGVDRIADALKLLA
jgi:hypothetical protein